MAQFEGKELACRRGGRLVFSGLDFAIEPGQALLLTGPNGSGKSSLLRIMAGLLAPAAGQLSYGGVAIAEEPEAFRGALHYLGHQEGIKAALNLSEQLSSWASLHGGPKADLSAALGALALESLAERPCRLLSAGQRRRLALARLLASHAPLWLLDEPTVGLDSRSRDRLARVMEDHRAGGGMVIAATHLDLGLKDPRILSLEETQNEDLPELIW